MPTGDPEPFVHNASSQTISYWDMISDLCASSGRICYVRTGETLGLDATVFGPSAIAIGEQHSEFCCSCGRPGAGDVVG